MLKVLVTGAAGFIGSFVSRRLLERGDEVVGLDNINDYYDTALKYGRLGFLGVEGDIRWNEPVRSGKYDKFRFVCMNLEDRKAMHELFAGERFDAVVNLAAQAGVRYSLKNPYAYVESNVYGFLNVLEGCRTGGVKHLVYASSSSVYGLATCMACRLRGCAFLRFMVRGVGRTCRLSCLPTPFCTTGQ